MRLRPYVGERRRGGGTPAAPAGTLVSATLLRDGWTVELAYQSLASGVVDPTKLTSVDLVYPATDYFGVALGAPPAVAGVSSHASPWWDANNPFPAPYTDSGLLKVAVRVNKPVRMGDSATVTVAADLVPGALAGTVVLDCSASMLEHFAAVEANPDPLGGLMARAEAPYGCRKKQSDLIVLSQALGNQPTGWFWGVYGLTAGAGAVDMVGYDTNGQTLTIQCPNVKVRDCRLPMGSVDYTGIARTGIIHVGRDVDASGVTIEWCSLDGGYRPEVNGLNNFTAVFEALRSGNHSLTVRYCHSKGTRSDFVHLDGANALVEGNYEEAGGWAEATLVSNPPLQPHHDFCETNQRNAGGPSSPTRIRHNFVDSRLSLTTGTYAQFGRTSAAATANIRTGVHFYRNGYGVGCRELDVTNAPHWWLMYGVFPSDIDIRHEECFMDKYTGSAYYHIAPPNFYGTYKWSNMRDFRTGAIVPDVTEKRLRLDNWDYLCDDALNRLTWS